MGQLKTCRDCGKEKPLSEFGLVSRASDGRRPYCKECGRAAEDTRRIAKGWVCSDCGVPIKSNSTRCKKCSGKSRSGTNHHNYKGGRTVSRGYVYISGNQGHPNANKGGQVQEHVLVMSEYLGRGLLSGESVHHKNGIRDDNRIENLELWVKPQPTGCRVEDALNWAKEIIRRYSDSDNSRLGRMGQLMEYEYGIMSHFGGGSSIHRNRLTEEQARKWVREGEEEDGFPKGLFTVVRRPISEWEDV